MKRPLSLGATSLATAMQMVANGYGVTLVPEVAVDVEVRDERVKLLRFTALRHSRSRGQTARLQLCDFEAQAKS
jgi:LysR family transcriptional regulator, hydrogen peroxide-inducible genes activator